MRVVQISDLHLFTDPEKVFLGLNPNHSFKAVLETIQEEPDLVLLTGDLAQDHLLTTYERLYEMVSQKWSPQKIVAIPGNHDDAKHLHSIFPAQACVKRNGWKLIFLNSQQPGHIYGFLHPDQLTLLQQHLDDEPQWPTLIFMHHNPVKVGSAWLDQHSLQNPDEFFKIVNTSSSIKAICFGHIHQHFESSFRGIPLLSVPSTCFQFAPRCDNFLLDDQAPGYRYFDLLSRGEFKAGVCRAVDFKERPDFKSLGY